MTTRKLGKYIMLETLGQGGFSKVRLGLDESTGERVALKILKKKEMGVTADVIKQVEREIHAMAKIEHQNVIRLKDVNWDCTYEKKNGTKIQVILVVLELATGGELFDFLAFTGPFEEAIARTYFQQLIAGISYCHSKGIAHRDLKPENILLDQQFVLKLADFGFAASFNAVQNVMYTECGTPGYMAPEIFSVKGYEKRGYEGAAADIWSCGVVLFIQLAGFPPFQRPAMNDWWFNKLSNNKHHLFWEAHQRTAYFSDLVKDFINKILCPDVTKRMKMDELMKHPWFLGPTISHTALHAELQRRKQTVDENKNREKNEKAAKVSGSAVDSAVPAQAGLLERGDVSMTRGEGPVQIIDYQSENLPGAVPSITAFGKGAPITARVGDHNSNETGEKLVDTRGATMTSDAFSSENTLGGESYEGEEGDESAWGTKQTTSASASSTAASTNQSLAALAISPSAAPIAPVFQGLTQSFTRFSTGKFSSPKDLYHLLQETLKGLGCTLQSNDQKYKIKRAKCVTNQGVIEFSVGVFRDPASDELIVDFKRLSSDSAQFRVLYAEIRYKLRDIISTQPNATLRSAATTTSS